MQYTAYSCPSNYFNSFPDSISQIFMDLSSEQEAIYFPSNEQAT